jgi:hypothetical protein
LTEIDMQALEVLAGAGLVGLLIVVVVAILDWRKQDKRRRGDHD